MILLPGSLAWEFPLASAWQDGDTGLSSWEPTRWHLVPASVLGYCVPGFRDDHACSTVQVACCDSLRTSAVDSRLIILPATPTPSSSVGDSAPMHWAFTKRHTTYLHFLPVNWSPPHQMSLYRP